MRTVVTPGRAFALALLVATATLVGPVPAQAHPADDWYGPYRWAPGASVEFGFHQDFPTGAARDRVVDSTASWNNNGHDLTPTFHATLPDAAFTSLSPCDNAYSAIFWTTEFDAAGQTRRCVVDGEIVRVSVLVDAAGSWYTGTGVPGSSEYDLQALVTHEFGHATGGWGWERDHFSGSQLCPLSADRQTMCSGLNPGVTWKRELGVHDIHTFQDAYGSTVNDCEVTYTITNAWPGNFQADVEVHNTGTSTLQDWTLTWTYDGDETVYNDWNVDLTQTGANVTATGEAHNSDILPGSHVSFGMQGTVTGSPSVPAPIDCTYTS